MTAGSRLTCAVLSSLMSFSLAAGACTSTAPGSSAPTSGAAEVGEIQRGNQLPKSAVEAEPSRELADNRIGISYAGQGLWGGHGFGDLLGVVTQSSAVGAKRVDTSMYEVEPPIDWTVSEYFLPAKVDRLIDTLADEGIALNYVLHFWDKAGHARGERLSTPRFQTQEQVQDFVDYVRFLVRHFEGRIAYYTIWSEPDNGSDPIKFIEPQDYVALARRIIPVIRREDPRAEIVLAPTVLFYARDYLFTILRSDVIRMFDVISWHPLYDTAPDIRKYAEYYYAYPSIVEDIKRTASANGFRGEYWGTELSWCSIELVGDRHRGCWATHSDIQSAKYYARAIVSELGMDLGVGLGAWRPDAPWSYPTLRHLSTLMAGARPAEVPVEITSTASDIVTYGFALPDGDRLLGLWRDGVAQDVDPGVGASLTFLEPADGATGVDVLYDVQQELVTTQTGRGLVIDDVIVRDYPIFLRLKGR